ncbi:LAME_0H07734g1_1 [Lachancea meyersii CBS 8951]|uniref:LAME_0H07734g1_1 n=1 Tax=Lachancea meyersii CBS 8951 TaxID=1266667 RepID=A0A1G4KF28_9SACH|nr:LAME_0H07734g1_1 [Lachancea meyersii CBS 8951]
MKQRWQRLLWLKQDFPDNHTDPDFLREVSELRNVQLNPSSTSSYSRVVGDFLLFYHRALNTGLMYITFTLLYYYRCDPVYITGALTSLAFLASVLFHRATVSLKSPLIIIFSMLVLSPVLKSLSRTTSSDSIWTISCWLTLFYVASVSLQSQSIVSTNLLVANVAVLASRLSSTTDVFCFLLICIELNVLLPYFERSLLDRKLFTTYGTTFLINNAVVYYFVTQFLGWIYTTVFAFSAVTFVFGLPRYFIYWQKHYYKNGPLLSRWDARRPVLD